MSKPQVTLFHSPNTRSSGALILLEELNADYVLKVLNMKAGENREAAFLAINPMGKVPAVLHGETLITEQGAVFLYLADLYADAGLAPQMGEAARGAFLRWLFFYGSCFEPAIIDAYQKNAPASRAMSPYGDFDTMFKTVTDQLEKGSYLLGEKFSAADVLWGTALSWMTTFGLVPKLPVIAAYIDRVNARPAVVRARARDAELAVSAGSS